MRPFEPLALALAAGAVFIARGLAGRSHELSDLIPAGIQWPGFAFVQVLSPCTAFRSEQFGWKENVHPASRVIEADRATAHAAVLADDGYSLGVLFRDRRALILARPNVKASLTEIEAQFTVRTSLISRPWRTRLVSTFPRAAWQSFLAIHLAAFLSNPLLVPKLLRGHNDG